ncbi:MAG: Na/Pi cotransporter family protein [Verrucomicrobia bacterium]|nr:Na/Pi cotransporter family protein [Verrucomicrobiota bacterium]MBV8482962.1 Na/Pi cotransporter family protein [Verrucomicrobiota bacterium]
MALINLASAIILILLGMRYLRKGLDRLFGNQLVEWLQQTAQNRYKAFLSGMVAGLISPSSSAIAVLSVQILNQSTLTAGRMLAVVLGANVGLTVIVQLITFDLQEFAGIFIVAGGIGFLFLQRAIFRGTGQILLGLGFIFLAMSIIGNTGRLAASSQDMKVLFSIIEHYPWLVFVSAALLALALQSSTACIGLGIGLAKAGLVSGMAMVPWVLGANLGIGLTMMIAGWASIEGRRLALASILLKGAAALLILIAGAQFASYLMTALPGGVDRNAANLNTLFNLAIGLLALPALSPISRCLSFLVPSQSLEEQDEPGIFLDPLLLQTPSLALSQAVREESRILDHLRLMLRTVWAICTNQSRDLKPKVEDLFGRVIAIQAELKDYLEQIADENLNDEDISWRFNLLDYSQELLIVATLIKRDLVDAAVHHSRLTKELRAEDSSELENIVNRTLERIHKATVLLMTQDERMANRFIQEKAEISDKYRSIRRRHLEGLVPGQKLDTNFFDLLNCFRRINAHLTSIAYGIIGLTGDSNTGVNTASADSEEPWLSGEEGTEHRKSLPA